MADKQDFAIAMRWLGGLADLCVGGKEDASERKHKTIAAALLDTGIPSAAFTKEASIACAKGDFFPGFDTLQTRLREHWETHRPASSSPVLLPRHAADASLSAQDRSFLEFWYRRRPIAWEEEESIRADGRWTDKNQLPLARLASMIRKYSPPAWAVISEAPAPLRRVQAPTADEQDAVRRSVEEITQHVASLPSSGPRARMSPDAQVATLRREDGGLRFGGHLTGDALAQAREQQLGVRA